MVTNTYNTTDLNILGGLEEGEEGCKGTQEDTKGPPEYRGLQEVTKGYSGLQGVTGGYKGLQKVTKGYKRIQKITKDYRGYKGLHGVTRG